MAPKKASTAAAVAKEQKQALEKQAKAAAKKEKDSEKRAAEETATEEEARKQKNILCNFSVQGKAAEAGTPLAKAFDHYKELPLHSSQKMQIALNWKADKSCSWLNTFVENHQTRQEIAKSTSTGWKTSFFIAKQLGMDHSSEIFKSVLAGYQKKGPEVWDENDPAENPFKLAGLDGYMFVDKSMEKSSSVEGHETNFVSTSAAKKAKLALADIVQGSPGGSSGSAKMLIVHEAWHLCNSKIRAIESALQLYTKKSDEMKDLHVKYLSLAALPEHKNDAQMQAATEERIAYMKTAMSEISNMEIKSLQIVSQFSSFQKDDDDNLKKFDDTLRDHLQEANNLHDAVVLRIKKNLAWLESQ